MLKKSTKEMIRNLLIERPHLRDNDDRLIATIWLRFTNDAKEISGYDLLERYAEGKLPKAEAIRRARQSVQESDPIYRGALHEERKKYSQKVRENIKTKDSTEWYK